ncbi:MAG: PhzF family phenazine biosynthesis protein [Rhizobiales bacterium]|nr:PhzF family phenazine biosynthesis protein [Hyphomicrobiales bacterium]
MQIPFVTVDVFTDRKFGGNPLAVIPDGRPLTGAQMQAIASEFNLAETTFVLPPREPSHSAEVRIFTPRAELPFAGHPNIGTAYVLAVEANRAGRALAEPLVFEEKAGLVRLDLIKDGNSVCGARLAPPQALVRGEEVDVEIAAAACSLESVNIETADHRPCIASCGIPFLFAELKTRAMLAAARPRVEVFTKYLPADRITGVLPYVKNQSGNYDVEVRMFGPLVGIPEDAASGSANVALAGLLTSLRAAPDLNLKLRIGQGIDMGRPSLLEAGAEKKNGKIVSLSIGGRCVPMMRGVLEV